MSIHPHAALIHRFYDAFARRDSQQMAACYHDDVRFSDPVFPDLSGDLARGMWHMLVAQGRDLKVEHRDVVADDHHGEAHWEAWYTFSGGRAVHNRIDATFTFRDGLIVTHTDTFNLYAWSRMALGPVGYLLGWTPFMQQKIRAQAARGLDRWIDKTEAKPGR